ncbi:MAG: uroporphyrinogen-III C-methyltransferase [Alphaproteobacteria bacterium HGW-Alphaproteobacteria-2]|nr:MAG: uroporphyrinogen-III C-methyltransferase [Alphaproteobacteria bacterium HGW-Alphaproteobacteria-2]
MRADLTSKTDGPGFAPGSVVLAGAGPGGADLLTLGALRALQAADVVIHDRLVSAEVVALARAGAEVIAAGKEGYGPSWAQDDICALMVARALAGLRVLRLKGGDPAIFGRLDEEIEALEAAGIPFRVLPGVTAASAAAASLGRSLTRRARNSELRLVTGHDLKGYAEQDWRALARPGEVAAIYMGARAARFLQGRLLMHGADPATPVTAVANAAHPGERQVAARLGDLAETLAQAELAGPVMLLLGIAPRGAEAPAPALPEIGVKELTL